MMATFAMCINIQLPQVNKKGNKCVWFLSTDMYVIGVRTAFKRFETELVLFFVGLAFSYPEHSTSMVDLALGVVNKLARAPTWKRGWVSECYHVTGVIMPDKSHGSACLRRGEVVPEIGELGILCWGFLENSLRWRFGWGTDVMESKGSQIGQKLNCDASKASAEVWR